MPRKLSVISSAAGETTSSPSSVKFTQILTGKTSRQHVGGGANDRKQQGKKAKSAHGVSRKTDEEKLNAATRPYCIEGTTRFT